MSTPTPDTPEAWGEASRGYADHVAPLLMEAFVEEFVDRLDPKPEQTALEVAAGSGALTMTLAGRVKTLLATDFAPAMTELLSERVKAAGVSNVTCQVMDGQALRLEDASVDVAACNFGLMLFPDRAKGFSELRRVVKPGGRTLVTAWADPSRFEVFGFFLAALKEAFPDMPPPPKPPPVFSLSDLDTFKREMEASGFTQVEVAHVSRDMVLADSDALWAMMTSGAPPVKMFLDNVGATGGEKLKEVMQRHVAARFGDGGILFNNTATLALGTVPAS